MSVHVLENTTDRAIAFSSRRRASLKERSARLFATCAQGAWLLLAATPVIVVICALKG
ncbi:hypothetical protein [Kozakia baliensis]|uniref:hypothetical protein n=1 Tax=Kozakia baliensis TaxID=153496 RepID=UPI00131451E0|nr:hypothetical protein [Kozakia baliensis]